MTHLPGSVGQAELVATLMLLALNAYALTEGADFGGGVWDLLASGPRRGQQREAVASAIAPIWEANHVWLIIVLAVYFTAFPPAFAALSTVLQIPLSLMLLGIILRGVAFVFRSSQSNIGEGRRHWGRSFAIASTATPVLLGVIIGAVSSGAVGAAHGLVGTATFRAVYIAPWFAPFPAAVGLLALALFAFLAATYLTVSARNEELQEDFRRRALASALVVFAAAFGTLALSKTQAPIVRAGIMGASWAPLLHVATGLAATVAQYPYLVPPTITIPSAAAPNATLDMLLLALAVGAVLLIPSLAYLLRTFARREETPAG